MYEFLRPTTLLGDYALREYEVMVIARTDLNDADREKLLNRLEGIMTDAGGHILKKDDWGSKKLAYPIKKQNRGHYFVFYVATMQANITELQRVMRFDENVLRSMALKIADKVDVEARKLELKRLEEEQRLRAAEAARERAEQDSQQARRHHSSDSSHHDNA